MKKLVFSIIAFLSFGLINAQEITKTKVHVKIEKQGEVIKDTVYEMDEDANLDMITHILEMQTGGHMKKEEHKVMAFKSEDGEVHKIYMSGDDEDNIKMHKHGKTDMTVTTEKGENGEQKITIKKVIKNDDGETVWEENEEQVFIVNTGEGEEGEITIHSEGGEPVWIEKGGKKIIIIDTDKGKGKEKEIKVVTTGESEYEFTTEDGETIIIKSTQDDSHENEIEVEVNVEKEKPAKKDKKNK